MMVRLRSLYGIVISSNPLSFMVRLLETTSNRLSFMVRLLNFALEMVQLLEFLIIYLSNDPPNFTISKDQTSVSQASGPPPKSMARRRSTSPSSRHENTVKGWSWSNRSSVGTVDFSDQMG